MINNSKPIKNYEKIFHDAKEKTLSPRDMHRALVKYFQEGLKSEGCKDEIIAVNLAKKEYDKNGDASKLEELYIKISGDKKGKNIDIKV